jgi:NAD+ kinase
MSLHFKRVGLFIRKDDPVMQNAIVEIARFIESKSIAVFINEPLSFLPELNVISIDEFPERCDLTIAIGGDGTILSASRELSGSEIPLVGINLGRLGFLADVTLAKLDDELTQILAGEYREDQRFLLQASHKNKNHGFGKAMNDVVIHSHKSLHMIEFETYINGRFLNSQRADGLVVSTPTGSTAYAMSAGGPILDVNLNALVLASVCPHTLSNRPLVISADSVIDIMISDNNSGTAMVTCDGRPGHIVEPGETIQIKRHPSTIKLLHLEDHDHYSILRAKLEWGRKLTC